DLVGPLAPALNVRKNILHHHCSWDMPMSRATWRAGVLPYSSNAPARVALPSPPRLRDPLPAGPAPSPPGRRLERRQRRALEHGGQVQRLAADRAAAGQVGERVGERLEAVEVVDRQEVVDVRQGGLDAARERL